MTLPASPLRAMQTRRGFLYAAFALLIVAFGASNCIGLMEVRDAQMRDRRIIGAALRRIEHVSRFVHDLDQKRLLIDGHIFERDTHNMERLEARIAEVDADMARAAAAYDPLATLPEQREAWDSLQAEMTLTEPIGHVLELSRSNSDEAARKEMLSLEARFEAVNQAAEKLIAINHQTANRAVGQIHSLQRRSVIFLGGITLSGMAIATFIAGWVIRSMRRRDEQIHQGAVLLETRNRELDAFAARVAHDLRGPLTTISLAAERLAQRIPQEEGTYDVLRRGVSRMEALIRDLLTLARIDAHTPETTSQTTSVAAAFAEDLTPSIERAGGRLHVDVEPATVRCPDGLLREALGNLGENAVKYRRPEAPLEVELRGRVAGSGYELRFSDNGSGMAPEEARRAFEPFFRGARKQSTPGTGLGLAIVKRVVESSGGVVSVESELGCGTTFVLRLPLVR